MKNPFITLTSIDAEKRKIRVNILHIITYSKQNYRNSSQTFTYMTNASPALNDTNFRESVEEIDRLIAAYYEQ